MITNLHEREDLTLPGKNLVRNIIETKYASKLIIRVRRAYWSNYCVKLYYFKKDDTGETKLVCKVEHFKTKIWR